MNKAIENVSQGGAAENVAAVEAKKEDRLITYLKSLEERQDRAALAHLRSGLREKDGRAMEMYPYLRQFLSLDSKPRYENAVFIIAALFAYYPDAPGNVGNLGASLRELKDESDGIEKRFVALLNADEEDLPYYLRQIIGLLKSKEVAVNWQRLFMDVQFWGGDNRRVQRGWARSFWGNFYEEKNQDTQNSGGQNL